MPTGRPLPDPMDPRLGAASLHAPWRQEYLDTFATKAEPGPSTGSFLRDYWLDPAGDERNHVIVRTADEPRGEGGIIFLNAYPYAGGHLLVALGDARPRLPDYTPAQRAALWRLVDLATKLMERTLQPQGINTGINQGRAAGAGVPQHLHVHLVPRWHGDTNLMSVVGRVRVIPTSLEHMAAKYRAVWKELKARQPHE